MLVKITCTCKASFEIKAGSAHPSEICCPNCGQALPSNATRDLLSALSSLEIFESKLEENSNHYSVFYSKE